MTQRKTHRMREGKQRHRAARRPFAPTLQSRDTYPTISNYSYDAGGGSQTFFMSDTWRAPTHIVTSNAGGDSTAYAAGELGLASSKGSMKTQKVFRWR